MENQLLDQLEAQINELISQQRLMKRENQNLHAQLSAAEDLNLQLQMKHQAVKEKIEKLLNRIENSDTPNLMDRELCWAASNGFIAMP